MTRLIVIGAGGHSKVVIDAALAAGHEVSCVVDESGAHPEVMGIETLPVLPDDARDGFVIAVGDNTARKNRFEQHCSLALEPIPIIHPDAVVAPSATIGAGAVVFGGVVVNADACIGDNVILNTGCTVDHDCTIGAHAHVAPGAHLCGNVIVGEGTLVGVGSCAVPGVRIGAWAVVGAGAAVTIDVADGVTVAGVPARPLSEQR